jgi:transposase
MTSVILILWAQGSGKALYVMRKKQRGCLKSRQPLFFTGWGWIFHPHFVNYGMPKNTDHLYKPYQQGQTNLLPPSLESLISPHHPVRVVNQVIAQLDLGPILDTYAGGGASSYHPRMMLKVLVYAYLRNIYSSRKIEMAIEEHVHFMWLAGGNRPDHNSINRFRSHRLKGVLKEVFSQVVVLLHEAGHLNIKDIYTDGTKLEANANRYTFVWAKSIERNRKRIAEQLEEMWKYAESVAREELMDTTPCDFEQLNPQEVSKTIEAIDQALKTKPAVDQKRKQKVSYAKKNWPENLEKYQSQEEILNGRNSYSKTDPDATFMRMKEDHMKNGQLKPGYNLQCSTHEQFIIHYSLHPNPTDTLTLKPHLQGYKAQYGFSPDQQCADAGYGSEENYAFLESEGIEAFVKYNYFHKEQQPAFLKKNPFHPNQLHYNQDQDHFICPMGQKMKNIGTYSRKTASGYEQQLTRYQALNCQGCPLRGACHKSARNRIIEVNHRLNAYKAQARHKLQSEQGIEKRKQRCHDVEAVFGILKQNRGWRRLALRSLTKVEIEVGIHAIAHNLRKLTAKIIDKHPKLPLLPIQLAMG